MLKSESTIRKAALRAIAFFTALRACINLAAFDAVKNDFGRAGFVALTIFMLVVNPETEDQQKTSSKIQEKENVYVE